jgi:hypothetical protein
LILSKLLGSNSFLAENDTFDVVSLLSLLFLLLDMPPGEVDSCLLKVRLKLAPDDK